MSDQTAEYAYQTDEGGWRVKESRVSLDSIVYAYWQGQSPEAIAAEFSSLSLEQVYGAIAFYLRNQQEIDAYLSQQEARWDELREASRKNPLVQRLHAARDALAKEPQR